MHMVIFALLLQWYCTRAGILGSNRLWLDTMVLEWESEFDLSWWTDGETAYDNKKKWYALQTRLWEKGFPTANKSELELRLLLHGKQTLTPRLRIWSQIFSKKHTFRKSETLSQKIYNIISCLFVRWEHTTKPTVDCHNVNVEDDWDRKNDQCVT